MSAILALAIIAQWHTVIVDKGRKHFTPSLFTDSSGYPVLVLKVENFQPTEFRWTDSGWIERSVPYDYDLKHIRLDQNGFLHIMGLNMGYAIDHHQTPAGWENWENTSFPSPGSFTLDSFGLPHFISGYRHCWLLPDSTTWVIDTVPVYLRGNYMMAVTDSRDNIHVMTLEDTRVKYALWSDSVWSLEIVEDLAGSGDLVLSGLWIYLDLFGLPHLFYNPFYYDIGAYRTRYAWKDSLNSPMWRIEDYYMTDGRKLSELCVDSLGVRHAVTSDYTGIYHVIRYPQDRIWTIADLIYSIPNADRKRLTIDRFGYLHLVFTDASDSTLYYATTNPEIGITEFPPEPRPEMILVPAIQGFYITGYSGEARIYDPAGRLVMSKEIKGKTLISPLSPGVYFVAAGKERARVAVR